MSGPRALLTLLLASLCAGCGLLGIGGQRFAVEVEFRGNHTLSDRDLSAAIASNLEDFAETKFKSSAIDDAAYQIERTYNDEGFPFTLVRFTYDEPPGKKPRAVFEIDEGPRTLLDTVTFQGNEHISRATLAPFFDNRRPTLFGHDPSYYVKSQVDDAVREVVISYLARGYLDVRVSEPSVEFDADRTHARVALAITEGLQYRLQAVELAGELVFERAKLERLYRARLGKPFFERLTIELQSRLEEYYADHGYADARVESKPHAADAQGQVTLGFVITPGPLVRIGAITIEGNHSTRTALVRERLALEPGQLYSRRKERESFRKLYQTGLFDTVELRLVPDAAPDAAPDAVPDTAPDAVPDETPKSVASESPPSDQTSNSVAPESPASDETSNSVAPESGTRDETSSNAAATSPAPDATSSSVVPGSNAPDATSQSVSPATNASDESSQSSAPESERSLAVQLAEAQARELFIEPGYGSYERARIALGGRDRNLFGTGKILSAEGSLSELSQSGKLNLINPWLLGSDTSADLSLFGTHRQEPSFLRLELGTGLTFSRQLSRNWQASLGYQYKRSDLTDVEIIDPEDPDAVDDVDISSILFSPTYDSRNNLFAPTSGAFSKLLFEFASDALGSQLEFVRVQLTQSQFFGLDERTAIAASFRSGVIAPIGGTDTIPLQERFFNGGENTVRSFEEDQLGPHDIEGNPLGGEAYSVLSVELRRKLLGRLEGALFYDVGNVVPQYEDYFEFDGLRSGVGIGLRYVLPVGPIRLDAALNPDPHADESSGELHFSVGMAF